MALVFRRSFENRSIVRTGNEIIRALVKSLGRVVSLSRFVDLSRCFPISLGSAREMDSCWLLVESGYTESSSRGKSKQKLKKS